MQVMQHLLDILLVGRRDELWVDLPEVVRDCHAVWDDLSAMNVQSRDLMKQVVSSGRRKGFPSLVPRL